MPTKLIYEDESYKVRGAAFDVYKALGCGHKETVYHKAYEIALLKKGLKVESEKKHSVKYEEFHVGNYVPDFIVDGKILIEIKAKDFTTKKDIEQFWNYLINSDYKVGFLINFGIAGGVEITRRVYDSARKKISV